MTNTAYAAESVPMLQVGLTVEDLANGSLAMSGAFYETATDWLVRTGSKPKKAIVLSPSDLVNYLRHCYTDLPKERTVQGVYLTDNCISTTLYEGPDAPHPVRAIKREIGLNQKKLDNVILENVGRDELILVHRDMVKRIISKLGYTTSPWVDVLESAGMLGLVESAQKYDPSKGSFGSRAYAQVRWKIIDELREIYGVSEPARQIKKTVPLSALSQEQLFEIEDIDVESPDAGTQKGEEGRLILKALGSFPRREQRIMGLYYGQDMNMKEVSEVVGVCEARISQIHKEVLEKLRDRLLGFED